MNLQEMVKSMERVGENVLIAEFRNGFTVAYEKGYESLARVDEEGRAIGGSIKEGESFVKYALLSEQGLLCEGNDIQKVGMDSLTSFSPRAKKILQGSLSQRDSQYVKEKESREALQQEMYGQMIEPLGVRYCLN